VVVGDSDPYVPPDLVVGFHYKANAADTTELVGPLMYMEKVDHFHVRIRG
jgi:hypothetical protein